MQKKNNTANHKYKVIYETLGHQVHEVRTAGHILNFLGGSTDLGSYFFTDIPLMYGM